MRIPLLRSLSGRIIMGFAVLILTIGTVSALTAINMQALSRDIRMIRQGYLRLALAAKDFYEAERRVQAYLSEEIENERTTQRAVNHLHSHRAKRAAAMSRMEEILAELEREGVSSNRIDRTRAMMQAIRAEIEAQDPLYKAVLRAPPVQLAGPRTALEVQARQESREALRELIQVELRIQAEVYSLQGQQQRDATELATQLEDSGRSLRLLTFYLGITAGIVGLLITVWATVTLRPLQRLRDAARQIAQGQYAYRIDEGGPDEVADLAREFNTMAHAIEERERELVNTERLVAVGEMAAMITHEVRNPLSSIGLNTELLEEELSALPPERAGEALGLIRSITKEIDRLTEITNEYLSFARLPTPKLQAESIDVLISDLVEFEREQLTARGVSLEVAVDEGLPPVLIDENQIRQALLNLLRNGAEAVEEIGGGSVTVSARRASQEAVEVVVRDDGPGISEEIASKLFAPFFSTKEGGTGLGLALSHQIVRAHGGELRVDSEPGRGASFVFTVPVAGEAEPENPPRVPAV